MYIHLGYGSLKSGADSLCERSTKLLCHLQASSVRKIDRHTLFDSDPSKTFIYFLFQLTEFYKAGIKFENNNIVL